MVAHDAQHDVAVALERREGAELARHLGRGGVGDAGHDGGDARRRWRAPQANRRGCRRSSAARRYWRSRGRACGIRRRAARSPSRGTAPSARRFRARWSTAGRHARRRRCRRQSAGRQSAVGFAASDCRLPIADCRKASRFSEARLQAVSSRNMYSEHGLEAMISPSARQVCQSLMVVWYWMPGSAEAQAAKPTLSQRSRAFTVSATLPVMRYVRFQLAILLHRAQELVGDAHGIVGVLAGDGEIGLRIPVECRRSGTRSSCSPGGRTG